MNTTTTNGMPAFTTTLNACVDLFFAIGASRGKDIIPQFKSAFEENADTAIRILLWTRDIRGGSGERQLFRDVIKWLACTDEAMAIKVAQKIPELGRFDDLLEFFRTGLQDVALAIIAAELTKENGLCAKWMPRKGTQANTLRRHLGLSPRDYRKLLVGMTNVVEQQMCKKDWNNIDFSKIPSVASSRYQKAFGKNATEKYKAYLESLKKGETKINAGAVYPYDIIKSLNNGDAGISAEQWKALPNYMEGSTERILPVVDVSGSMTSHIGGSSSISCLDVAVSLGLYISERNVGVYKDKFITFSSSPKLQSLSGNLQSRLKQLSNADWGMSTNLESVFSLILQSAKMYSVNEDHMPTKILILSDMQFDVAVRGADDSAIHMISKQYEEAGYKLPSVIFWNINAHGNVPTTFTKQGTALVSGFSPAIMKSILSCTDITPVDVMMEAISDERYNY